MIKFEKINELCGQFHLDHRILWIPSKDGFFPITNFDPESVAYVDSYAKGCEMLEAINDVAEWWIFSSLHGESKLIPFQNKNVVRPFLLNSRKQIENWA
jgi:hypothetical protein